MSLTHYHTDSGFLLEVLEMNNSLVDVDWGVSRFSEDPKVTFGRTPAHSQETRPQLGMGGTSF